YVVLNNLVKDEIAKGDLAKATAYWGAYEFTMKVTRLVLGSTFGVAVDKFGRKPALQLNSAAAICCVLTVYSVQTLWALVLGGAITGGLDIIDVSVQAIVSDVGRAISHVGGWDGSDDKVTPEQPSHTHAGPAGPAARGRRKSLSVAHTDLREKIEHNRTKLFGGISAVWVISVGVALGVAGAIVNGSKNVEEDEEGEELESGKNCTLRDLGLEEEEDYATAADTSHLTPAVIIAIGLYGSALLVAKFLLTETAAWSPSSAQAKDTSLDPFRSFKLLFSTPWLKLLTICLMITDAVTFGYVSVILWFVAYQFGWDVSKGILLLMWALICNCVSGTVALTYAIKYLGLWGSLYMSCAFGVFTLLLSAISGAAGPIALWVGLTGNLFACHKHIIRGKICAEFTTNEQGTVQGGIIVSNTLSQMAGVFLSTSLFSWVITYEMDGKTFDADCDPPARSLLAGLPFFVLSFGALMTMGLVMWGRRFDPVKNGIRVAPLATVILKERERSYSEAKEKKAQAAVANT
ncbi:hypothetical protein TeGR_g501, partial [Tetraparma gracilis]